MPVTPISRSPPLRTWLCTAANEQKQALMRPASISCTTAASPLAVTSGTPLRMPRTAYSAYRWEGLPGWP
ncbi:hypothetical protein D3C81_1032130 [compost metagenome]